ncbi:MAG: dephospho-CoA kinase [Dehalococcoidales bacterium]|nr:dephospho-CoA kinase [Dehalococcoidales bacterium]
MMVIGLTGGIGSGKSTVAGLLAELGARCLDLDKTGHEVLRSDADVRARLVEAFGDDILGADGEIDRTSLGNIVFSDADALSRLNAIIHPAIDRRVQEIIGTARLEEADVVVLEAAVMLDAGRAWQVDEVWITVAPEEAVIKRVTARSGYTEEEVKTRIRSQMTDGERIKLADVIIDTDCTLEELCSRVGVAWEALMVRISPPEE